MSPSNSINLAGKGTPVPDAVVLELADYLMEDDEEAYRLDLKTDPEIVEKQALWAGIRPGMRVADLGCGSGKTSAVLYNLVQPGGEVIGLDFAPDRYHYAIKHYEPSGVHFECRDVREPLDDLGKFDFIWVRFLLEYYLSDSFAIVKNISNLVKPGGILCLIDLDHNCMNHYGISDRLVKTMIELMGLLQKKANFDPFVGRKLFSFFYDLGYEEINVAIAAHHLIYGPLNEKDDFNWARKIEVAPKKINYQFKEYAGSYEAFLQEFENFFKNPRRFTYTPIISCRGRKPSPA